MCFRSSNNNRNQTYGRNHVGANLMFALRTTTGINPMFEGERPAFILGHRFDFGFCSEGEHKVRPYIGCSFPGSAGRARKNSSIKDMFFQK
jgi:hypothetical protein